MTRLAREARYVLARLVFPALLIGCATPSVKTSSPAPEATPTDVPVSGKEVGELVDGGDLDALERRARELDAAGRPVGALSLRVELAELRHDPRAMREALASPHVASLRRSPTFRYALASAVGIVLGPAEALTDLDAVCADTSSAVASTTRANACAEAAGVRLVGGRAPRHVGENAAVIDLLRDHASPSAMFSVNRAPPEPFILDTGTATTALSKNFCDRADVPYLVEARRVVGGQGGGELAVFPARVRSLEAAGLRVDHVEALATPLYLRPPVGGVIAPHRAFAGALVELDFRTQKVRVDRDSSAEAWAASLGEPVERVDLVWSRGSIFVRATLAGHLDGWLRIGTGSTTSFLRQDIATKLGDVAGGEVGPEAATKRAWSKPLQVSLNLAGGNTKFDVTWTPYIKRPSYPVAAVGLLGQTWMRGRRIAIAPDGRSLSYTPRQDAVSPLGEGPARTILSDAHGAPLPSLAVRP